MDPARRSVTDPSSQAEGQAAPWEPPAFEEIRMDAEIGSYQEDDGGEWFEV